MHLCGVSASLGINDVIGNKYNVVKFHYNIVWFNTLLYSTNLWHTWDKNLSPFFIYSKVLATERRSQYLYKSCKADAYCFRKSTHAWYEKSLPSQACNKSLEVEKIYMPRGCRHTPMSPPAKLWTHKRQHISRLQEWTMGVWCMDFRENTVWWTDRECLKSCPIQLKLCMLHWRGVGEQYKCWRKVHDDLSQPLYVPREGDLKYHIQFTKTMLQVTSQEFCIYEGWL